MTSFQCRAFRQDKAFSRKTSLRDSAAAAKRLKISISERTSRAPPQMSTNGGRDVAKTESEISSHSPSRSLTPPDSSLLVAFLCVRVIRQTACVCVRLF